MSTVFVVTPSDIIGGIVVCIVVPACFLWAVYDVYIRTPRRRKKEDERRYGRRGRN